MTSPDVGRIGAPLALLALIAFASAAWCAGETPEAGAVSRLGAALGGDPGGFARADAPRAFSFPADHGPHPDYRSEWWYFTGNLATGEGRAFGFQLTFFRFALAPHGAARPSAWASRQLYLAHFTLSDIAGGRFHAYERVSRGALGLAGAEAEPFRVWLEDWRAGATGDGLAPLTLSARAGPHAIELELDPGKPPVLQGEAGLSRKSAEPGNASYYYSVTRLPARGRVDAGDGEQRVTGTVWMDREWSTSALAADQVGWDWFALQLSDGRDLMFYRLRLRAGGTDRHSAGSLVGADGRRVALAAGDVDIAELGYWQSPRDGARYPARWRLRVPAHGLDLEVVPRLADQELDVAIRYWEGAVTVSGSSRAGAVHGYGYVELTGYAD